MFRYSRPNLVILGALLAIALIFSTPFNGIAGDPEPSGGGEVALGSIDGAIVFSPEGTGFFVGSCNGIPFAIGDIPFDFDYGNLMGADLVDFRLGSDAIAIVPADCVPNGAQDIIITIVTSFTVDPNGFKIAQVKMKFIR